MPTDYEELRIGEVFKSRKNRVFRIKTAGEVRVAKIYPPAKFENAREEFELLGKCFACGLKVPEPIELDGNVILMSYLDGSIVTDVVDEMLVGGTNDSSDRGMDELAQGLAEWLSAFHRSFDFDLCRGDTILRNFVRIGDVVNGLDFEEAHEGDPTLDLGELCANVLGMRPLFGPRNARFARTIASRYWHAIGEDRSYDLPESIAVALEHYAAFRNDRKDLEKMAKRFRKEGMALLEQYAGKP